MSNWKNCALGRQQSVKMDATAANNGGKPLVISVSESNGIVNFKANKIRGRSCKFPPETGSALGLGVLYLLDTRARTQNEIYIEEFVSVGNEWPEKMQQPLLFAEKELFTKFTVCEAEKPPQMELPIERTSPKNIPFDKVFIYREFKKLRIIFQNNPHLNFSTDFVWLNHDIWGAIMAADIAVHAGLQEVIFYSESDFLHHVFTEPRWINRWISESDWMTVEDTKVKARISVFTLHHLVKNLKHYDFYTKLFDVKN